MMPYKCRIAAARTHRFELTLVVGFSSQTRRGLENRRKFRKFARLVGIGDMRRPEPFAGMPRRAARSGARAGAWGAAPGQDLR